MNAHTLSPKVAKPDHVPDAAVYDFDMFADPEYLNNPHARLLDLVQNAPPVFWTPRHGGHWVLVSYQANFDAARDVETFSSEIMPQEMIQELLKQLPPETPRIPQPFPINLDPPLHGKYRMPIQGVFSPKTVNKLQDDIRQLAIELIDQVADQGGCEVMSSLAEPLPVKVFLKMLGLPLERMPEYRALVEQQMSLKESDPESMNHIIQIVAAMRETIEQRRDNPQDDILSMLWSVQIDGKPITQDEVENYSLLLFIAGLDTVMKSIGYSVEALARNPDLQTQLRDNPELIPEAVEELLRRYSFVIPIRYIGKDTVFQGIPMKAGERVRLFLPTANLDSAEFPQAEQFDLNRERKTHIVFNAGPHRCLGSHLARLELQILIRELMTRLPPFHLDPERPPRFHGGQIVGHQSLHIQW